MKQLFLSALALLLCATTTQAQVSNNNEDEVYKISARHASLDFVPGEVLVKFRDGSPVTVRRARGKFQSSDNASLDAVLQSFDVEEMEKLLSDEQPGQRTRKTRAPSGSEISDHDMSQLYRLRMAQTEIGKTTELVEQLATLPEVEYAEPNYRAYIMGGETISQNPEQNPSYPLQWGITALKINELWTKPIVNPSRPIIAILDTGVDTTHPDLKDNIWSGGGYDFINETTDIRDYNSHGTHVAGIAAAVDNGEGIIGANPQALIMPVTVMQSDGTGDVATIIRGIDYAVQNGATVLNMSLGTYTNSRALRQALERAYQAAVIVAAAGNDRLGIYPSWGNPIYTPCFPAAYSFVIGVQAIDVDGNLTSFSNYDCDGPNFSIESDPYGEDGLNYEMCAPGINILSTVPNGGYKQFNGTSMAAPLVAGAISALQMVKGYDTQEMLWGDLLHTANFLDAYNLTSRPAELELIGLQINDRRELEDNEEGLPIVAVGDGHIDAGETINLYPVLRTVFGEASNIKLHLEVGEYEDESLITIVENDVEFGYNLSPYGKNVSQNPLVFKTKGNVVDGRKLTFKLRASCDNAVSILEYNFSMTIDNLTKIGGLISQNMTLTADKVWLVTSNIAVPEGITLKVEPGTIVNFMQGTGISSNGRIVMKGEPDKPIKLQVDDKSRPIWSAMWNGISVKYEGKMVNEIQCWCPKDTIEYCYISNAKIFNNTSPDLGQVLIFPYMKNCLIQNSFYEVGVRYWGTGETAELSTFNNCEWRTRYVGGSFPKKSNMTNSEVEAHWQDLKQSNFINNKGMLVYPIRAYSGFPATITNDNPPYLGTTNESKIHSFIADIYTNEGYGSADISNVLREPIHEAHGIVWKVVVNGYDAQDEYDMLPPLGIGRHKFEVWYNRPMNKAVAPHISFGVREPYTQNAVEEDGAWNEDGTIYTAYATITRRTASDGVNRIYVFGGEDDEHFECPYEKSRFNINIQAASSMGTGFMAEGRDDHIKLSWSNTDIGIGDAMGYNIYRYVERINKEIAYDDYGNKIWDDEKDDWKTVETIERDTIRINPYVIDIDATSYADHAVTDGETYYYFYKLQGTNLKEYGMSNTVKATTSTSGIAIISADEQRGSNGYYDLSGRRLNRYPAKKACISSGERKSWCNSYHYSEADKRTLPKVALALGKVHYDFCMISFITPRFPLQSGL